MKIKNMRAGKFYQVEGPVVGMCLKVRQKMLKDGRYGWYATLADADYNTWEETRPHAISKASMREKMTFWRNRSEYLLKDLENLENKIEKLAKLYGLTKNNTMTNNTRKQP
jgi:oligoribonuclease NrnB/cAMP/cGMP phosphodiesterase (DHH superfamily)